MSSRMPFLRGAATAASALVGLTAALGWAPGVAHADEQCIQLNDRLEVVGVPRLHHSAGAIEVTIGQAKRVLTRADLGLGAGRPGDRFGAAVSQRLLEDGCGVVLVGAPGVDASAGAVFMLTLAPDGSFSTAVRVDLPSPAAGDQFGYSLAMSNTRYVAGAPGRDVKGKRDAGAIAVFDHASPGLAEIDQSSPGVPGGPEAGDRFGEVLGRVTDVVWVGVPREDVGSVRDAGVVESVDISGNGSAAAASQLLQQRRGGVFGPPEAGDHFGASFDRGIVGAFSVGVPGEDVGRVNDAGAVNVFRWAAGVDSGDPSRLVPARLVTQSSPGVPGKVEAGDRFGAAVEAAQLPRCFTESEQLAIGSPGEDVGRVADAGAVTLYDTGITAGGRTPACSARSLTQGSGLSGRAEAGDRAGSTLLGEKANEAHDPRLLVGVPGEDVGTLVDAGLLDVVDDSAHSTQFALGARSGLRYGTLRQE